MFKPGLDASSSLELLNHLNLVAESGRLVILTIHQPRLEIFHLFHKILFLCDGQVKQLVANWSSLVWLICSCAIFLSFFGLLVRFTFVRTLVHIYVYLFVYCSLLRFCVLVRSFRTVIFRRGFVSFVCVRVHTRVRA